MGLHVITPPLEHEIIQLAFTGERFALCPIHFLFTGQFVSGYQIAEQIRPRFREIGVKRLDPEHIEILLIGRLLRGEITILGSIHRSF